MKYSDVGQFTDEQIKIAKRINSDLKKLSKSCCIYGKAGRLEAYLKSDMKHAADMDSDNSSDFIIPSMTIGIIRDSGADDEEYFEKGYITGI